MIFVVPPKMMEAIRKEWTLFFSVLFFIGLYFYYFPPIFAYRDEGNYLTIAYHLRQGHLFFQETPVPIQAALQAGGELVPRYAIGNSLALIPFTFGDWRGIFLLGLTTHLLGTFFFRKLAHCLELKDPLLPVLYLFFPAFLFYSRTIMSDVPSLSCLVIAFYLFYRRETPKWMSATLFGAAVLFKYTHALFILFFGLSLWIQSWRKKQFHDFISFALGLVPWVCLIAGLNNAFYGAPWRTPYSFLEYQQFAFMNFLPQMAHYSISLMLMYPLMLFVCFASKKIRRPEILLSIMTLTLLYTFYHFHDPFPGALATRVFGIRYLFPVIALMLLGYGDILSQASQRLSPVLRQGIRILIVSGLMVSSVLISQRHQDYLMEQENLKALIYENTEEGSILIYDSNAAELLQEVWGERRYLYYDQAQDLLSGIQIPSQDHKLYLATRHVLFRGKPLQGLGEKALQKIQRHFILQIKLEKNGLTLFELTPKQKG